MALREIRSGDSPVMSSPLNTIRPAVGRMTPVKQLKSVDLPAPLGPMIARISPGGTVREIRSRAVRPPNRTVSPSVARTGATPAPPDPAEGAADIDDLVTLGELAGGRDDRLVLRHHFHDVVLAALELVDELADEGLVVLPAEQLVPLREVLAFLHLEALEGIDQ